MWTHSYASAGSVAEFAAGRRGSREIVRASIRQENRTAGRGIFIAVAGQRLTRRGELVWKIGFVTDEHQSSARFLADKWGQRDFSA
jgi:hypothetical protein